MHRGKRCLHAMATIIGRKRCIGRLPPKSVDKLGTTRWRLRTWKNINTTRNAKKKREGFGLPCFYNKPQTIISSNESSPTNLQCYTSNPNPRQQNRSKAKTKHPSLVNLGHALAGLGLARRWTMCEPTCPPTSPPPHQNRRPNPAPPRGLAGGGWRGNLLIMFVYLGALHMSGRKANDKSIC